MKIKFIESKKLKDKPDQNNLGFGQYFTDYMFEMDYLEGKGWVNPIIKPYSPICIEPSSMVLHYGQSVFEGLKAYLADNGDAILFRADKNIDRMNKSNVRMCIPELDSDFALQAIIDLVRLDKSWIPNLPGTSLYIRPFAFANDPCVGVRRSESYKFIIILSPVGSYYSQGFGPVKIHIEEKYVRAVRGGIGEAKTAGNYAASIKAQTEAKKKGYSQVLWLDGVEQKYIEEVGAMNVFFKIDDEIITPKLNGSILDGITRDSSIKLLKNFGYHVAEREISINEVLNAYEKGSLKEVFGTGTAAVISPVGEMFYENNVMVVGNGQVGDVSMKLYETLSKIQTGKTEDEFNWTIRI